MTRREFVEYLRANSVRCRTHAGNASDREAAQALREVAAEMEIALRVLESPDLLSEPATQH